MGIGVINSAGEPFAFSHLQAWGRALDLAYIYGCQPAGTEPGGVYLNPDFTNVDGTPLEWEGGYETSDLQIVTAQDARAIARALEKALPDIPDHDDMPTPEQVKASGDLFLDTLHPFEFFGGPRKAQLQEFIEFCRKGAFSLH